MCIWFGGVGRYRPSILIVYFVTFPTDRALFAIVSFAEKSDGGIQIRTSAAAASVLTPAQKHNEMQLNNNYEPSAAQPPQPLLGNSKHQPLVASNVKTPCTCGVFLSSQISKGTGSSKQPAGYAALMYEQEEPATCNTLGVKTCTNKCLEIVSVYPRPPRLVNHVRTE